MSSLPIKSLKMIAPSRGIVPQPMCGLSRQSRRADMGDKQLTL